MNLKSATKIKTSTQHPSHGFTTSHTNFPIIINYWINNECMIFALKLWTIKMLFSLHLHTIILITLIVPIMWMLPAMKHFTKTFPPPIPHMKSHPIFSYIFHRMKQTKKIQSFPDMCQDTQSTRGNSNNNKQYHQILKPPPFFPLVHPKK